AGPVLITPDVTSATSPREVVDALANTIGGQAAPSAPRHRTARPRSSASLPVDGSLEPHLSGVRIVVTCGAGGVGKTSISAALAVNRAATGMDTALLTVDPAHRLATALGLPMVPGETVAVPVGK